VEAVLVIEAHKQATTFDTARKRIRIVKQQCQQASMANLQHQASSKRRSSCERMRAYT